MKTDDIPERVGEVKAWGVPFNTGVQGQGTQWG